MTNNEALYEVEAHQVTFKDTAAATVWLDKKRKELEDAGLTVVQYSCLQVSKDHTNANIQATRGAKPGEAAF